MLLVNANDLFHLHWEQLNHHRERFTYADTIAPLFMFVVGMGMRISWLRRSARDGASRARLAMAKRLGLLVLIYILQSLVLDVAESFRPEKLSLAVGITGFAMFYGLFAGLAYYLYRRRIFIRI